jgi:hypothetical protein
MSKHCRSCGEPLTIAEVHLDDKLRSELSICLPCLRAALREIKKEEELDKYYYYYYEPDETDV